ncbi:MAG: plasmid mobilization relaxosome protein MobC [Specibacter sp.]
MALFSRRKPAAPASTNPFVAAAERLAEQREREAAEAAAARPVFEPRKAGRPAAQNPRTRRVSMSLTEEEHAAWTAAAEGRGLSAWARDQVAAQLEAEHPRGGGAEVAKLRADLGRVGSNLNQLVRAVNSGHAPSSPELLEAVQATREELARVRGELP